VKGAAEAAMSKRRSELNSLIPPPMRPPVYTPVQKSCHVLHAAIRNGFSDRVLILIADVALSVALCEPRRHREWKYVGERRWSSTFVHRREPQSRKTGIPETAFSRQARNGKRQQNEGNELLGSS